MLFVTLCDDCAIVAVLNWGMDTWRTQNPGAEPRWKTGTCFVCRNGRPVLPYKATAELIKADPEAAVAAMHHRPIWGPMPKAPTGFRPPPYVPPREPVPGGRDMLVLLDVLWPDRPANVTLDAILAHTAALIDRAAQHETA